MKRRSIDFFIGRLLMHVRPAPLASLIKRLLYIRRRSITTGEGVFWVDPASFSGLELAENGVYERATLEMLRELLRPGDTFVDIGANEGYFTVVASRIVGATGRVLAVEPQVRLGPVLSKNLAENGCTNVEVIQAAVSDKAGSATLHLSPDMNNASSGLASATRYRVATQPTPLVTLMDILGRAPGARPVVKIDIEGFEYEAVRGGEAAFRSGTVRALILESHDHILRMRGLDVEALPRLLLDCGYERLRLGIGWIWARPGSQLGQGTQG